MISKAIGPFKSIITLKENTLTIILSRQNDDSELFVAVTEKDIPYALKEIVESLNDLYKFIENFNPEQILVKDGRIFFIFTIEQKETTFSFQLSQRFLKEQTKTSQNQCPICPNCQEMKKKLQIWEMANQKQRKEAYKEQIHMAEKIKQLEDQIAMKNHHIQQLKTVLNKAFSAAPGDPSQAFPQTLKPTFLIPSLKSAFFTITHNQIQLFNAPNLPNVCLLISDEPIPAIGKHTFIIKYLQTNNNSRESSVCIGLMGGDRAKTKSCGGKGQKFSIGFWNKKDNNASYVNPSKHGEIWVDGEIVVINKRLFVPLGEWIRMDVDIQVQEVEFITKEGPIVTRKFPINYEGKQFYFFVRMADPKEKIEIL